MKSTMLTYIDRFRQNRRERLVLGSVLLILAMMVAVGVYWQLRYVGITMTNETYCGYEEHVHTEECYEYTLACGLEESEGHTHTDECYEEQQVLVCGLEESEGHTHAEECYDENGNLICGLEESEGHTHTSECYETQLVLVCGLEESEGHTHTDDCYEAILICELEEHSHTAECLIDLNADVEDATIWEATLPELTGDIRTDTINIAYSQLGYTESTANYTLAEDGITHLGYTRYGTWYGSSYSDWDSIFVAFCLDYAGIEDEFTYNAGAYAWSVDLANLGYYQTADVYTASIGDVVFIDTDDDGKANISAIVVAIDETAETITVIQGNYSVTDADGNTTDTVALVTYSTVVEVEETAEIVTLSAESEEIEESEETEEITPVILGYANISPAFEEIEEVEEVTEETADETEEEVDLDEGEEVVEETEEIEELEETNETILLATSATDYVTQVTELYTYAMTLTSDDSATAASVWNALMDIWEQIYAEEEAGTLALTDEEYDNVDALTDEVYYYFVDVVGYDPYGVMTVEDNTITLGASSYTDFSTVVDTLEWDLYDDAYYSSTDGLIHVPLEMEFTGLSGQDIIDNDGKFYLALPDGVIPSDDLLGIYISSDSSSLIPFTYSFVQDGYDSDGNPIYYIEIEFDTSNVNENYEYYGSLHFEAIYGETDDDDEIKIRYDGNYEVIVSGEDIKSDGNETYDADIYVTKSSSSYDVSSNTITYTIKVWSTKGTDGNAITLSDLLSVSGSGLIDDDIVNIEINSVTSTAITVDQWGNKTYDQSTTEDATYSSSATDDGFTLTLGAIDEDNLVEYTITYTVTFEPESTTVSATVANTATATVNNKDIENEAITSTRVSTSYVDKSGSYSDGYITWTITVNPTGSDIVGLIYTDDAFADAIDLVITNATTGEEADSSEWSYTDSTQTAITFNATTAEGTNTNTYTITYKTEVEQNFGVNPSYENDITVTNDTGEELDSDSSKVTTNVTKGSLTKSFDGTDGTTTENGYTYVVLKWSSSITVPSDSDGIAAGTVIYDYLGTNDYDYYSYDQTSKTSQWYTYDQIIALFSQLTSTISTNVTTNFTLSAYDPTVGDWVTYDTLTTDSTYESHVFTAFKIVFNEDVDYTGTIDFSYSTTANVTGVETSKNYYNILFTGNLKATANYTYYNNVYKTDGKDNTGDSTTTLSSNGNLTWRVKVYVTEETNGTIKIADTPTNLVEFVSATVSYKDVNNVIANIDSSYSSDNSYITAELSPSETDVYIYITEDAYSSLDLPDYIIVTYTYHIKDFDPDNTKIDKVVYQNDVTVYFGDDDNTGTHAEQKQTVTYPEETTAKSKVEKDVAYNQPNGLLNYYVVVNINEEDIDTTSDYLNFVDTMTTTYSENWTTGLIVSLKSGSVKFYQLIELIYQNGEYYYDTGMVDSEGDPVYAKLTDLVGTYSSSDLYYADNGTAYYKLLLDIAWTYSEEVTAKTDDYTTTAHVISATIPDETAIYVEYSYYIDASFEGKSWNSGDISNTASVSGETSESKTPSGTYSEPIAGGTSGTSGSLTLIKVDGNNFSSTLSGAVFTIYKYVDGTNDEAVGTITSNANGSLSVTMNAYSLNYNTLYYLVETTAPEGYLLDDTTKYYFYWYDADVTEYSLPSDLDTITSGSLVVPLSEYSYSTYVANYSSSENMLTVRKKVYSTDTTDDERLSGATYTLYEYDGTNWVSTGKTYTTSTRGNIQISMSDGLTYNTAYKLVETEYPDGYEPVSEEDGADHTDQTEVYFWWSSSNTTLFPLSVPDETTWSTATSDVDGSTEEKAIDLASESVTQVVTNTPIPTTSVSVAKSWTVKDENDEPIQDPDLSTYAAKAQLYYYLVADTTSGGNTGGTVSDSVTIYFTDTKSENLYTGYTESTASSDSYTNYSIPSGQENVSIKLELSSYNGWWYEAYSLVDNVYSSYDSGTQMSACGWTSAALDVSSFTASADYYVIYSSPAATKITISYTDSSSGTPVDYEYTYTTADGWVQTAPAASTPTPSGGNSDVEYDDLVGTVGTSDGEYGQAYVDENGEYVYATLYYSDDGDDTNDFVATISGLPLYTYINGTKYYYYYYFVETSATGATPATTTDNSGNTVTYVDGAIYSTDVGLTGTEDPSETITITNTVQETDGTTLPSTGGSGTQTLYEFGAMLILLALSGAGIYRNLSRLRESLAGDPRHDTVTHSAERKRLPDVRNRKFVTHRNVRKGDTRAGPDG